MNIISLLGNHHQVNVSSNLFKNIQPGQIIKARVIDISQGRYILSIGKHRFQASSQLKLPIGSNLALKVVNTNGEKTILAVKEMKGISINNLANFLGYGDTKEINAILAKLIKNKIQLSKDNLEKGRQLASQLPLSLTDGIDVVSDPYLYAAIFSQFPNSKDGYGIFLKGDKETAKKEILQISIILTMEQLGDILVEIKWDNLIQIEFYCSEKDTVKILQENKSLLQEKLVNMGKVLLTISHQKNLFIDDYSTVEGIQLKGIDTFA